MAWEELAKTFPDHVLIRVDGSAFEQMMGSPWAEQHPKVPLLLTHAESAQMAGGQGLEFAVVTSAIERFLADLRTLEDHSETVAEIRGLYRDLYLAVEADFWREIESRLGAALSNPEALARLALLALSLWPDSRSDPNAWKLWFFAGWAYAQLGDRSTAARLLEPSVALNPNATAPLGELAALRLHEGRNEEGEALLERVLAPDDPQVQHLIALADRRSAMNRPDD